MPASQLVASVGVLFRGTLRTRLSLRGGLSVAWSSRDMGGSAWLGCLISLHTLTINRPSECPYDDYAISSKRDMVDDTKIKKRGKKGGGGEERKRKKRTSYSL